VQSSWPKPPKEPFPYLLFRKKQLIGGFATLKEAQEAADGVEAAKGAA
jgi:hypothetical protein